MMKSGGVADLIAEFVAAFLGWAVCLGMLAGGFVLGYGAAHFFGLEAHRESAGLLSAISVIWIYESRKAHDRQEAARRFYSTPKMPNP